MLNTEPLQIVVYPNAWELRELDSLTVISVRIVSLLGTRGYFYRPRRFIWQRVHQLSYYPIVPFPLYYIFIHTTLVFYCHYHAYVSMFVMHET